ncbi:fibronectin type III domain-containing protein [Dyadobacter sp. CY347]|uniref:fibronectin type III domain-containing protein n=1 Tax=Dyadobacter sp. CY347 TaxID=2909336 RepID=UPI001F39CA78|nr:fibronectin type III domain-containing protein [Dyadobacter sp. CY347]MCF2490487.1 fibronectin type III domain-containing protein [Dyadobacter sp. CY347]
MNKHIGIILVTLLAASLHSCSMFTSVDPLPPAISELTIVEVKRTEITVSGIIGNPDAKNSRQEKKSGPIIEYGLVYGTTPNLDITKNTVLKLDSMPTVSLVTITNQRIGGLSGNTDYYIALYARNEGGGLAYGETVNFKTATQGAIKVDIKSSSNPINSAFWYDLDEGKITEANGSAADVTIDLFEISGRGLVISFNLKGSTSAKNLGPVNFDNLTYLNLASTTSYETTGVGFVVNANSVNSVVAFKTGAGRFGKWRIESVAGNVLVSSLTTYEN